MRNDLNLYFLSIYLVGLTFPQNIEHIVLFGVMHGLPEAQYSPVEQVRVREHDFCGAQVCIPKIISTFYDLYKL